MDKILPFYGKIWSSHGPSYWFFMNLNQCSKGRCKISEYWVYPVAPLLEMAKIWPFYGQNMVLTWFFLNLEVPRDVLANFHIAWCILALLWPKHSPHMVFLIG